MKYAGVQEPARTQPSPWAGSPQRTTCSAHGHGWRPAWWSGSCSASLRATLLSKAIPDAMLSWSTSGVLGLAPRGHGRSAGLDRRHTPALGRQLPRQRPAAGTHNRRTQAERQPLGSAGHGADRRRLGGAPRVDRSSLEGPSGPRSGARRADPAALVPTPYQRASRAQRLWRKHLGVGAGAVGAVGAAVLCLADDERRRDRPWWRASSPLRAPQAIPSRSIDSSRAHRSFLRLGGCLRWRRSSPCYSAPSAHSVSPERRTNGWTLSCWRQGVSPMSVTCCSAMPGGSRPAVHSRLSTSRGSGRATQRRGAQP